MSFYQETIAWAKIHTHIIQFSPFNKPVEVKVVKVRGNNVWVQHVRAEDVVPAGAAPAPIRLNDLCSRKLMNGDYLKKRK